MQWLSHTAAIAHTVLALGLTVCATSSSADTPSRQVGVAPGEFLISRPVSDRSAFRPEPPTPAVNKVRISPAPEIGSNMGMASGDLLTRELSSDADFARIISNSSHLAAPGGALPSSVSPAATASSLRAASSTSPALAPISGGNGAGAQAGGIGGMVATPILNALGALSGSTR